VTLGAWCCFLGGNAHELRLLDNLLQLRGHGHLHMLLRNLVEDLHLRHIDQLLQLDGHGHLHLLLNWHDLPLLLHGLLEDLVDVLNLRDIDELLRLHLEKAILEVSSPAE